jgi:glycosidase
VIGVYNQRKTLEADIISSHGDATRFFVTFLDNHDMKERIRYEMPENPTEFDDQVTLGLACLFALPGIPCVYYGSPGAITTLPNAAVTQYDGTTSTGAVTVRVSLQPMEVQILSC